MPTLIEHEIEGIVSPADKTVLKKHPLIVHAVVKGTEVAKTEVDRSGRYNLVFRHELEKPTTELHVVPAVGGEETAPIAATELLTPSSFSIADGRMTAHRDLTISSSDIGLASSTPYSILGQVFVRNKHIIEPFAGAKLYFEVVEGKVTIPGAPSGVTVGHMLAQTCTAPDGSYSASGFSNIVLSPIREAPYVTVAISELANGQWSVLYTERLGRFVKPFREHLDFLVERK